MNIKTPFGSDDTNCNVLCVDMDAFFASVEIMRHPELKNKPVAIGGPNTTNYSDDHKLIKLEDEKVRGVVSTANYVARKYGVHSALPLQKARKLCPSLVILPSNMNLYKKISNKILDIFYDITPKVEMVSIDEGFLDIEGAKKIFGPPVEIAALIKKKVKEETGVPCSVGVANNKLFAKLATNSAKPDGIFLIPSNKNKEYVHTLTLKDIWGVGPKTVNKLSKYGLVTVNDIDSITVEQLERILASKAAAQNLKDVAEGKDAGKVEADRKRKSYSKETTLFEPVNSKREILKILNTLTNEVTFLLRSENTLAKTVSVGIRTRDLQRFRKSFSLKEPTNLETVFYKIVKELFEEKNIPPKEIRTIGMGLSNLYYEEKIEGENALFAKPTNSGKNKRVKIEKAIDGIRNKYGSKSVNIGT